MNKYLLEIKAIESVLKTVPKEKLNLKYISKKLFKLYAKTQKAKEA